MIIATTGSKEEAANTKEGLKLEVVLMTLTTSELNRRKNLKIVSTR